MNPLETSREVLQLLACADAGEHHNGLQVAFDLGSARPVITPGARLQGGYPPR
jgi:hypothetical protein